MSDTVVLNVRQITQYPFSSTALPADAILIQRGGLGGPYRTLTAGALVSTALEGAGSVMGVGATPPDARDASGLFASSLQLLPGAGLLWNLYDGYKYWANGPGGALIQDPSGTLNWLVGLGGNPGTQATLFPIWMLDALGNMRLPCGTLTVSRDAGAPLEVVTLRQLDAKLTQAIASAVTDLQNWTLTTFLPLTGGSMTGPIYLAHAAASPMEPVTYQQMEAELSALGGGGGGEGGGGLSGFLPLSGGALLGALYLSGNATQPLMAVPYQQLADFITSYGLYQGTWNAGTNQPDLASANPQNDWSWIVTTPDPNVPVTVPFAIPGLTNVSVHEGDHVIWSSVANAFQLVRGSNLNMSDALGMFLPTTGGTLSGNLVMSPGTTIGLSGNAVSAMQPVTLQQMNAALATHIPDLSAYLPLTGGTLEGPLLLAADAQQPLGAATLQQVQNYVFALQLYQGTWDAQTNTPNLMQQQYWNNDWAWIVITPDPNTPVTVGAGVPGLQGQPVWTGDHVIYSSVAHRFDRVRSPQLSLSEAEAIFMPLTGGTFTGNVHFNVSPTLPGSGSGNQPVTFNQMNAALQALGPGGGAPDLSGFMPLSGGVFTGMITLAGNATQNMQPVTLQQLNAVAGGGVSVGSSAPVNPSIGDLWWNTSSTPAQLNIRTSATTWTSATANYLPLSGGTLTGMLTLPNTNASGNQAVRFTQVQSMIGGPYLPLTGGSLSGNLRAQIIQVPVGATDIPANSAIGNIFCNQVCGGTYLGNGYWDGSQTRRRGAGFAGEWWLRTGDGIWICNVFTNGGAGATVASAGVPFYANATTFYVMNPVWVLSDEREKSDISSYQGGLAAVLKLKPKRYRHLDHADIGVIAQDLEQVLPEAVQQGVEIETAGTTYPARKYVSTTPILAALISAVQELARKVEPDLPTESEPKPKRKRK